jgi:FtsP/CotA-like multicopper oxidase with cupredoxin domain
MKSSDFSRRRFLELASLAAAGGVFAGLNPGLASAMMRGGMMGGGRGMQSWVLPNPPPGTAFRDPAAIGSERTASGYVEVALNAGRARLDLNGSPANLLTYNGLFNGPTIRVRTGDRLRVRFRNDLPLTGTRNMLGHFRDLTNLHTHGLHVSPSGKSDNVHLQFAPGQSFVYEYDLSRQEPGTLCFYHPHIHGSVAEQYWAGMVGALVVEDETGALKDYETHLVLLKDISLWGEEPEPHAGHMDYMMGKKGRVVLVNGLLNPVLTMRPGQVQRWRVLNASNSRFYNLAFENHLLHLIGTDGGLLDRPYPISRIMLAPGERIDLLVKASSSTGNFRLLSLPYPGGHHHGGEFTTITLMTVACRGKEAREEIPPAVNPEARRMFLNLGSLPWRRITLSMRMHRGFINGLAFGANSFTMNSKIGTYEVWEILNASGMDHPFHQHVNEAQVISITGGDPEYARLYSTIPAWKDTVNVPAMGSVTLLVPVRDYTGMAMVHCHILEHEDIGMMGIWNIA